MKISLEPKIRNLINPVLNNNLFLLGPTCQAIAICCRTKIPSFNDQNFSRHLPEHLISLLNKILFFVKSDTVFFS